MRLLNILSTFFLYVGFHTASFGLPLPSDKKCLDLPYTKELVIERTQDWNVKATMRIGSLSPVNPCSFWAYSKVVSPSARHSEIEDYPPGDQGVHNYRPYQAKAEAILAMDLEDGMWSAEGKWRVQDDTSSPPVVNYYPANQDGQQSTTSLVRGFVQLTRTDWTPGTVTRTGQSLFNVHVFPSNGCGGNVTISGKLDSYPANLTYQWKDLFGPESYATTILGVLGGQHSQAQFPLTLLGGASGIVKATGTLIQLPINCDPRPPGTGSFTTATLTVSP